MQSAAQTAMQTAVHTIWKLATQTTAVQSTMQMLTKRTLGVMAPQRRTLASSWILRLLSRSCTLEAKAEQR
eukprot:3178302-Pleurochrysis_carterae.AAC.1